MSDEQPLKRILASGRDHWDSDETRPAVRDNFKKMLDCRTAALGAEIYASENEEKLVYHTCKSRACPSCGHRATQLWQREQWSRLPDIPYVDMVLTMPNVLWPIFEQNRNLLHDLPALGAEVIQQWVKARYGVRVLIIVVQHTFGGRLNFHPHLHLLISNGGLHDSESRWMSPLRFNRPAVMHMWRYAVITYLREALRAGLLRSEIGAGELRQIFTRQYERWWNTYVGRHFRSKAQFLSYAGRYIRRPPIAEHRFAKISESEVHYLGKDSRGKRRVRIRFSTQDFITTLAEHVPDRYHHAVRYFGLLAPRSAASFFAVFMLLEQPHRPRPRRLSWAASLRKMFGVDPLIDSRGQPMRWVHRLSPIVPQRHPA